MADSAEQKRTEVTRGPKAPARRPGTPRHRKKAGRRRGTVRTGRVGMALSAALGVIVLSCLAMVLLSTSDVRQEPRADNVLGSSDSTTQSPASGTPDAGAASGSVPSSLAPATSHGVARNAAPTSKKPAAVEPEPRTPGGRERPSEPAPRAASKPDTSPGGVQRPTSSPPSRPPTTTPRPAPVEPGHRERHCLIHLDLSPLVDLCIG